MKLGCIFFHFVSTALDLLFDKAILLILAILLVPNLSAQTPDEPLNIGIIGDSTVSTYPEAAPQRGWGQVLSDFFIPDTNVLNLAKSGASTKTFPPDRWQQILDFKPDFVLIQFGHNDQHAKTKPEATDADGDYKENLRRFVKECRQNGAMPILVTPMHRRTFDSATLHLTTELEPYVNAMKEVGQELNVPIVDLYETSGFLFESLGEEGSEPLTLNNTDNADRPGKGDRTHFTSQGAQEMARLVVKGLANIDPRLKAALKNNKSVDFE